MCNMCAALRRTHARAELNTTYRSLSDIELAPRVNDKVGFFLRCKMFLLARSTTYCDAAIWSLLERSGHDADIRNRSFSTHSITSPGRP